MDRQKGCAKELEKPLKRQNRGNMKNVIVGTAGHVDHGKTCLIKALTGTDTDRLKEEKKRGITIELGFTNMPVEGDMKVGIIDVPGHEKFVKNMLAGIGGIDLVLLVIALDEGVMPQTMEHFEVLRMLNIPKGIVVLTKADTVDEEWAELVKSDIEDLLKDTFLEGAPMLEVSSYTGKNIDKLKQMIVEMVEDTAERISDPELFRLPIDRVFTMTGFGTVITGTLLEGSVKVGDEILLYPKGLPVKIRGIQVHGEAVEEAFAGQRTAINLLNVKKEDIDRGDILAREGCMELSTFVDVKIKLFGSTERVLKNNDRVHINFGSAQVLTKVILLNKDSLKAGESAYAQLRFDEPVAMKKGDKFIVRFYSPVETFGGGVVLEAEARKHKRNVEGVLKNLSVKENGTLEEVLEVMISEESLYFPDTQKLATKIGRNKEEIAAICAALAEQGKVYQVSEGGWYHKDLWQRVSDYTTEVLGEYHEVNPISPGMSKEEFKSRLVGRFHFEDNKYGDVMIEELSKRKVIGKNSATIALAKFEAKYSSGFAKIREDIIKIYTEAGFEVPQMSEATAMCKDKKQAQMIMDALVQDEILVKVVHPYYMEKSYWEKAVGFLKDYLSTHETIALGDYRDGLGTSRKYAVMLLEAFDAKKITVKVGDARKLK